MTTLLDLYEADTGTTPHHVTSRGKSGPEYAGPCPTCGGKDRFRVWPDKASKRLPGGWWCRGESKGGDTIGYCIEHRRMTYPDACALLGLERENRALTPRPRRAERPQVDPLAARETNTATPADIWQANAAQLVAQAEAALWGADGAEARAYLAARGINEATARRFRIGWISAKAYYSRPAWGLPEEVNEKTGKPRRVFVPPGILIPGTDEAGHVVRLRVRYWTKEHGSTPPAPAVPGGYEQPKYMNVIGSAPHALVCGVGPAVVVVESDLDALLLVQDAGDIVAAVALGSADVGHDERTAQVLRAARVVLVSLDNDEAGAKAAWQKWAAADTAAVWPVHASWGKDPGEARQNGLDLRAWILAGLQVLGGVVVPTAPVALAECSEPVPAPINAVTSANAQPECPTVQAADLTPAEHEHIPSWDELIAENRDIQKCVSCPKRKDYERWCDCHPRARKYHPAPVHPCIKPEVTA